MLHSRIQDQENFWKIVKDTRMSLLLENADLYCRSDLIFQFSIIQDNINSLAAKLKFNTTSYTPKKNISFETLQTAVEMFTYLNYCPPKLLDFKIQLLQTGKPRELILALISLKESSQKAAEKSKLTEILINLEVHIVCIKQWEL